MQNIKNFKLSQTAAKQLKETSQGALFLTSEDGRDWYEAQQLFSDDTIKIMYDNDGVIISAITEVVPSRGNTRAVSMLWPVNASVAEVESVPDGFSANGQWLFTESGEIIPKPPTIQTLENKKSRLLDEAANEIDALRDVVKYAESEEEKAHYSQKLAEWEAYRANVYKTSPEDINTVQEPPIS